jgi:hypothetical protein
MGRAIRGVRDQLFITTEVLHADGHLPPGTPVAKYMEAVGRTSAAWARTTSTCVTCTPATRWSG